MPRKRVGSGPSTSSSKLDEQPLERLQAWLNKYQDERAVLLEKLLEDDLDEDPEMVKMKL